MIKLHFYELINYVVPVFMHWKNRMLNRKLIIETLRGSNRLFKEDLNIGPMMDEGD
jgi:hypothetical protein